jgi:ABC-2 type transport system ATP-binding protein
MCGARSVRSVAVMSTTAPPGPAIETAGLCKRFGARAAVDGVDLEVPRATAFGFLGPNGAGKTTVVRMLLGLTRADAGTMRLLGRPVPDQRSATLARVGAIVDEPRFLPFLTGRENLRVAAAAREAAADRRIDGALDRAGLATRADERVAGYSMGMRQRLGIARCLLADPQLLILDEPTNGLDPAGITEFRAMVGELVAEGRTVFLSSHLLGEIEKTCDAVAIVDRGRVLAQGPVHEIASPTHPVVVVGTSEAARAATVLAPEPAVLSVTVDGDALRLELAGDGPADRAIDAVVRRLVGADIPVHRVQPRHATLEERFLSLTSRFEKDAA